MSNRNYLYSDDLIMYHWLEDTKLYVEYDEEDEQNHRIDSSHLLIEIMYKNEGDIFFMTKERIYIYNSDAAISAWFNGEGLHWLDQDDDEGYLIETEEDLIYHLYTKAHPLFTLG